MEHLSGCDTGHCQIKCNLLGVLIINVVAGVTNVWLSQSGDGVQLSKVTAMTQFPMAIKSTFLFCGITGKAMDNVLTRQESTVVKFMENSMCRPSN